MAVHDLVAVCKPLDTNSLYCNLLQCSHFADTSIAAWQGEELLGFISGYHLPEQPDTLFIWQVAVSEKGRGKGLATRMLMSLLGRSNCRTTRYLQTTITPDNAASWALFNGLAEKLEAQSHVSMAYDRDKHFGGRHESEKLLTVGPFKQPDQA